MAWETAVDRLFLRQIHTAEKEEQSKEVVQRELRELWDLAPGREGTAFLLGYGRALLGLDLPEPSDDPAAHRWYAFGRLRGHDRRGERNWVMDLFADPTQLMELMGEPRIAAQCLPVVVRTLFWSGDLDLAVKAVAYLAEAGGEEMEVLVDAALSDLISRLEKRVDRAEEESSLSILQKCTELGAFPRLPADVRARYMRAVGVRFLQISEFASALEQFREGIDLASDQERLRSSLALWGALTEMRLHDLDELAPRADRPERDAALAWFAKMPQEPAGCVPEAWFAQGILAYEQNDYANASRFFDRALDNLRRRNGRDRLLIDRTSFFLAASLLAVGEAEEVSRALRLLESSLATVHPDLESFYSVHEAIKDKDRKLALAFLDAIDLGRGTAPDQLLLVALEYVTLGEAVPAAQAAERVLHIAVDLDQRIEAMRIRLTVFNMQGDREAARGVYQEMRDLLLQRGAFQELENLLKNEEFVGQALDHMEIKCELVDLYEEMEDRDYDKAALQSAIARSLKAKKEVESLREAFAILREVEISFPDLARDELQSIEKHLALSDATPAEPNQGGSLVQAASAALGRTPRVLVVGGNERQRRHHPRFTKMAQEWGFDGEWLEANYSSPQKLVNTIGDRLRDGIDLLILLHWNRHETTEPALELARKAGVMARTLHYAGFTSLEVCLTDQIERLGQAADSAPAAKGGKKSKAGKS